MPQAEGLAFVPVTSEIDALPVPRNSCRSKTNIWYPFSALVVMVILCAASVSVAMVSSPNGMVVAVVAASVVMPSVVTPLPRPAMV